MANTNSIYFFLRIFVVKKNIFDIHTASHVCTDNLTGHFVIFIQDANCHNATRVCTMQLPTWLVAQIQNYNPMSSVVSFVAIQSTTATHSLVNMYSHTHKFTVHHGE